jgi:hypothetical protein
MFGYTQLYEIHFYIRIKFPSCMALYQQVLGLNLKIHKHKADEDADKDSYMFNRIYAGIDQHV